MVTNDVDVLFSLCRKHLDISFDEGELQYKELDFARLREIIIENGLTAFLYKQIKEIYPDESSGLSAAVRQIAFQELGKLQAIRRINEEAARSGVTLVFFKGILLSELYPQSMERVSSDSDILVSDDERQEAERLLSALGYIKNEEHSKIHVQVYQNARFGHTVELHTRLWEDYEGPRIEKLKEMNLTAPDSLIRTRACGIEVTTLGAEQHLLYQIFHIIKHFSLNGVGIRYLIDITLFVNKYFENIDFTLFWNQVESLGYTTFVEEFFSICIEELAMTNKVFDHHRPCRIYDCNVFKMDLLNIGNINDKEAGWQIMGAMEAYFTGEAAAPKSKLERQISMVFPPINALPKCYGYAIKYPVLLPIAWAHRAIAFLIKRQFHKDDFYGVGEKIGVAERRMRLINELGLAD